MFDWMINRSLESSGFIPEAMLEIDDLVKAGNRPELQRIFERVIPVEFANMDVAIFKDEFDNKQLASWSWYCLKRIDNPWEHLVRTGKYTHIFK